MKTQNISNLRNLRCLGAIRYKIVVFSFASTKAFIKNNTLKKFISVCMNMITLNYEMQENEQKVFD